MNKFEKSIDKLIFDKDTKGIMTILETLKTKRNQMEDIIERNTKEGIIDKQIFVIQEGVNSKIDTVLKALKSY